MRAYERFLNYVKVPTASLDGVDQVPSTQRQFDLSRLLAKEMEELGLEGVYVDEHAYVYGYIPASQGMEDKPCIAFNAHIDTVSVYDGEHVKPQVIENYDGGAVELGNSGKTLTPEQFPDLKAALGKTLITTDGTTVLGADDKAGIAEIMTAAERIIKEKLPHGRISLCFSPDEEVGNGGELMDLQRLGADFGFTVDGDDVNEINYETFNAAGAYWEINGFSVHPGSAKDTMINANLVAMEINSMLPAGDVPSKTENYQGFFHLTDMSGNVERANLEYIIRDHDPAIFEARKETMRHIEELINTKYGENTAKLTIKEQYRNMAILLKDRMDIIALAEEAIRKRGLEPVSVPMRGGTDGACLSFRGLLCPNLGTGGHAFHGPYEHITAESMDAAVEIILAIIEGNLN